MSQINRRLFLGGCAASGIALNSQLAPTLLTPTLLAQRPKRPMSSAQLADAMRTRLIDQIKNFRGDNGLKPTDAQHVAQIEAIHNRYRKEFAAEEMKYEPLVHSLQTFKDELQSSPPESSPTPPLVLFSAWDTKAFESSITGTRIVRCVVGVYNPYPTWQNRLYCKLFIGEANMVRDSTDALRAIDTRFPVLTEPGAQGESPEVPASGISLENIYALPPFPAINTDNTVQQGMVLPPMPLSIWDEDPYKFPPAFRPLGFTITIPSRIGSREVNYRSTNFVAHAVLFKLEPKAVSTIERRISFVFRA